MNLPKLTELLQSFYEISGMDISVISRENKILARRYSGTRFCACVQKKSTAPVTTPEVTTPEVTTPEVTTPEVTTEPNDTQIPDHNLDKDDGEFSFLSYDEKLAVIDARRTQLDKKLHLSSFNEFYDFYGYHSDCMVFRAYDEIPSFWCAMRMTTTTIDGVDFEFFGPYISAFGIFVYKDGKTLDLPDAFDEGRLTSEDIRSIAAQHNSKHCPHNSKIFGNYPDLKYPADALPNTLSDEVLEAFRWEWIDLMGFDAERIIHCGNYDGVAVFMRTLGDSEKTTVYYGPNGEKFEYKSNFILIVYHDMHAKYNIFPAQLGGFLDASDITKLADYVSSLK